MQPCQTSVKSGPPIARNLITCDPICARMTFLSTRRQADRKGDCMGAANALLRPPRDARTW